MRYPCSMADRSPLKLLCVTAHPDDECFIFGGALMLAAERGIETSVVCFTDGQAASNRGTATTPAELGRMRREEFAASCGILGVTHHEVLDYQDGQLEFADFSKAAGLLVERIRRDRPQIVLTFGGDGALNTHADHSMASFLTTAAVQWAAQVKRYPTLGPIHSVERLYFATYSFFFPGRPAPLPAPWTVTLDTSRFQQRKFEAFRAHITQLPLMERFQGFFEKRASQEHYMLAATPTTRPAEHSTDLFAGL